MLLCIFSSLRLHGACAPNSPISQKYNCLIFIIKHILAALFYILAALYSFSGASHIEDGGKPV
jgi:hypothetical protein